MSRTSLRRLGRLTSSSRRINSGWLFCVVLMLMRRQTSSPFSISTPSKMSQAASMRFTFRNPHR